MKIMRGLGINNSRCTRLLGKIYKILLKDIEMDLTKWKDLCIDRRLKVRKNATSPQLVL